LGLQLEQGGNPVKLTIRLFLPENIRKLQKLTYWLGFLGPLVIMCGSFLAAMAYSGKIGERYSFLNHFISELGEVGISEWAMVFNVSLFIGGLCITGFMLGSARNFNNRFGWVFAALGLVTGISGSLVGIFPMNNLDTHIPVAMWFFRSALAVSALYAIYVIASKQDKFSHWTSIPAASISIITFIFLFLLEPVTSGGNPLVLTVERPAFWSNALLEWGIFFSIMVWVLATSFDLFMQTKKAS
jgi:hypothetical membrane protein